MLRRIALCSGVRPHGELPAVNSAQSEEVSGKRSAPMTDAITIVMSRAISSARQTRSVRRKVERAPRIISGCAAIVIDFMLLTA